jgi:glycosyltransferase involved in cell wall biosynthesis
MASRARFIPLAIHWFQRQTVKDAELVIVTTEGEDIAPLLMPYLKTDDRIRYFALPGAYSIGAKYNAAILHTLSDHVCLWEDDDWFRADRLELQFAALEHARVDRCGMREMLFWDIPRQEMYRLNSRAPRDFVAHGSLMMRRAFWERAPYPDMGIGNDYHFQMQQPDHLPVVVEGDWYVAMRHGQNSWSTDYTAACWKREPVTLADVIGADEAEDYAC